MYNYSNMFNNKKSSNNFKFFDLILYIFLYY